MDYYVAVDCEGPACVVGRPGELLTKTPEFEFVRRQATREADAVARGLFEAGARRVIVWDNHGCGVNLVYEELDKRCEIVMGVGHAGRFPGLEKGFAGVVLVGYHAMEATEQAVLAHTFSSSRFRGVFVGDRPVGEVYIDAACAGVLGVPVQLVVGDDKLGLEAQAELPGCRHVQTKVSLSQHSALSKHPLGVLDEIHQAAKKLIQDPPAVRPLCVEGPFDMQLRFKTLDQVESALRSRPGWRRVDGYTIAGLADDLLGALV